MSTGQAAEFKTGSGAPGVLARFSWLRLIGLALLLSLLALMFVQGLPIGLARSTSQAEDEAAALAAAAAEAQGLRLSEQLRPLDSEADVETRMAALADAYNQWRLRTARLRAEPVGAALAPYPPFRVLLGRIEAFNASADAVMAQADAAVRLQEAATRLRPALLALDSQLQAMARDAAMRLAPQAQMRGRMQRWQPHLALFLTALSALLTAAFATTAWRQLHTLRLRRGALEELTDKLRLAQHEAEAASQAKSTFLANMSHEIRTPFHGLMGMLSLLREAGLTARQVDYLRTATESADHLLALLNDILDMSQLESGRLQLSPTPVKLRQLLGDVEALMRPQASLKSLALHIDADPAVPERVMLDATRVRQILFNLLSNAIKFSDRGTIVLDLRRRRADADGSGQETLEFIVTDTGSGMDEATVERLFNRFMQGDTSLQRRHGGSGLGLEISRNLARLMDGDIEARSKPGQGSCFTFRMPLRPLPADEAAPLRDRPAAAKPARQLRVLVAEDHPVNRQYLAALLENQGHLAHFSSNGEEAVLAAREQAFDVVLMDVHMPVLDGIGATRAIRACSDPARATVPIVALTADAFPETADRCMAAGMNDYLTKPVSPQGLASCLRRLFGTTVVASASETAAAGAGQQLSPGEPRGDALLDPTAMALALQAMPLSELKSMIEDYLAQGPDTVQRLRAAIRGAQPLDLRVHAHAAKGAALNLGLVGLAATAQALQGGAAHLPAHEIARLVLRFEQQLLATHQALDEALEAASVRAAAHARQKDHATGYTMMGSGSSRMPKRP